MSGKLHSDFKPKWTLFSRSGHVTSWREYEKENKQWWSCHAMTSEPFQGEIITEISCSKTWPPLRDLTMFNELAEVRGRYLHLLKEIPEGAPVMEQN